MTLVATAALALLLGLVGAGLLGWLVGARDGRAFRGVLSLLAGILVLHALLTLWAALDVAWTRTAILAPLLVAGVALHVWAPKPPTPTQEEKGLGWGEIAALVAVVILVGLALTLWIATPDFIFHWGLKGRRYFLAHTIDFAYLSASWNWPLNPNYPSLLPELFATSALLVGRFSQRAMMLWTGVWFVLLLLSARETLLRAQVERATSQATLAIVAFTAAMVAIGYRLTGDADWMIALALVAALPPMIDPEAERGDCQLGLIAAFAAAAKTEGVVLAGLIIGVRILYRWRREPRIAFKDLAALIFPAGLVVLAWQIAVRRHALSAPYRIGAFELARAPAIATGLFDSLNTSAWHGLSWTILPLLALVVCVRRLRPFAWVVTLLLLAYLAVYFTAVVDVPLLVIASFPRLLLHFVPALLVGGAVAIDELCRASSARPAGSVRTALTDTSRSQP